jgi:RNA polymerase sigma-70 factor (ECF subfamily)
MAPTESVVAAAAGASATDLEALPASIDGALLEELWVVCDAASWGLAQSEFNGILLDAGTAWNYGLPAATVATPHEQATFFHGLRLPDLLLARACAAGNEHAWRHFVANYQQPLARAAIAITGSETLGRDLADQLYAEIYGLTERDGERRCPLSSYRGRGSLMGWLRTTLAQRHVDHYRRTHREEPIDDVDPPAPNPAPESPDQELSQLERALGAAIGSQDPEERFLLAAYYLDGQTLLQVAHVLGVHEATISRKLQRVTENIRKQLLKNLQRDGLSKRAAQEALGTDPRDLNVNLKKLLQHSQTNTFKDQAEQ